MERYFCRDKKDYCDTLNCRSCEFAKGHDVIDGVYANDVLTTLFGENYDLGRLKELTQADREGRCVIAEKPPESGNKYVLQTVQGCCINGDVTILKQSALKAMKERK